MGNRALLLAMLAVFALGYGLMRQIWIVEPSMAEHQDEQRQALPDTGEGHAAAPSNSSRQIVSSEPRSLKSTVEDADWPAVPIPIDIESDGPPIEVGEPLEVDDEWGMELALKPDEPVDIGVHLEASDPQAWTLEASPEPLVEIGPPLDAEDLRVSDPGMPAEESVEIGPPLDADEPSSWEPDEAVGSPIEVGDFLDAGGSKH